jgi:UDP-glucose 4-epimerase
MNILVTGGAGYIGSHTAAKLLNRGHAVVIIDNFSNSHPETVKRIEQITKRKVTLYKGDVQDKTVLERRFLERTTLMR